MMKRLIVMTFMVLGILQVLSLPSYCDCSPTHLGKGEMEILIDGKDVTDNERIEVRPRQNILFKVVLRYASTNSRCERRKVNFRFTKMESESEGITQGSWAGDRQGYYEETDKGNVFARSKVGIHWKVDGKVVAPGRYLVEVQAPNQSGGPVQLCTGKSNILTREVAFSEQPTMPDEIEFENE